MKIISINSEHTTDIEHVSFNIEDPPVSTSVDYGTLCVRIEDGLLKVTAPIDGDMINANTLRNIIAKFDSADAKIAKAAASAEQERQRILAMLARETNLPIA